MLWADLSGASGHVGVAGGPRAGTSTVLRALVCAAALTHTPDELGFHLVDLGGGTLAGPNEGQRHTLRDGVHPARKLDQPAPHAVLRQDQTLRPHGLSQARAAPPRRWAPSLTRPATTACR